MEELKKAIRKGNKSAPGKDGVSYELLNRVSESVLYELLALINVAIITIIMKT